MKRVLFSAIVLCVASQVHAQTYDSYGRAHSPPGGMWYNGQFYAGGQYLPMGGSYTQSVPATYPQLYGTPAQFQNWVNSNMIPQWGYGGWDPPVYGFSDFFPGMDPSTMNLTGRYTPRRRLVRQPRLAAVPPVPDVDVRVLPAELEIKREVPSVNIEEMLSKARSESERITNDAEVQQELYRVREARGTYYGDPKAFTGGPFRPTTPAQMSGRF